MGLEGTMISSSHDARSTLTWMLDLNVLLLLIIYFGKAFLRFWQCTCRLIEVLRDFGRSDWQLASMVCQTLWNYSGKITSTNACFGDHEASNLIDLLIEYLGKFMVKSFDPHSRI